MSEQEDSKRREQVEALVRRLEPKIIDLFQRCSIDAPTASAMLEEVITLLLYRWGEITWPDSWFLEMLEHRARRCRMPDGPG